MNHRVLSSIASVLTLGLALTACGTATQAPSTATAGEATPLGDGWIWVPAGGVQKIDGKLRITAKITGQSTPGQVDPRFGPEAYICVYTDINYQGDAGCKAKPPERTLAVTAWINSGLPANIKTLNDVISSVRIADGGVYKLFEDADFKGRSIKLTGDAPWLGAYNFNDITSSLQWASFDF